MTNSLCSRLAKTSEFSSCLVYHRPLSMFCLRAQCSWSQDYNKLRVSSKVRDQQQHPLWTLIAKKWSYNNNLFNKVLWNLSQNQISYSKKKTSLESKWKILTFTCVHMLRHLDSTLLHKVLSKTNGSITISWLGWCSIRQVRSGNSQMVYMCIMSQN